MPDVPALERLLQEIEQLPGVNDAVLVSKSGLHISGRIPRGVVKDTYTTMCAVLLGSAEAVVSGLDDRVDHVSVQLDHSQILVVPDGPKALFVLHLRKEADPHRIVDALGPFAKRAEEFL